MVIQTHQLFTYTLSTPTPLDDFIDFWADLYYDRHESLYSTHIDGPHTPEGLLYLFQWKIGRRFFESYRDRLCDWFINRSEEAKHLSSNWSANELRVFAEQFLTRFQKGGAIWRIFWLHCWIPSYPIYDQH